MISLALKKPNSHRASFLCAENTLIFSGPAFLFYSFFYFFVFFYFGLLFSARPVSAESLESLLLKARNLEQSASSPKEYNQTIDIFKKLYIQARREKTPETAALAMYSMASVTKDKLKDNSKYHKYLKRLISYFPGTSWADRAALDLKKFDSADPGQGYNKNSNPGAIGIYGDQSRAGDFIFRSIEGPYISENLNIRIRFSEKEWVSSIGTAPDKLYTFSAPAAEMSQSSSGSVPNITLYAFVTKEEINIIDYVNAYQQQALKDNLPGYILESQDIVNISGVTGVQKTFKFLQKSVWYKAIQFYLARGKRVVILTYMSRDSKYLKYLKSMKNFVDSIQIES
jgi:hypothetical protein